VKISVNFDNIVRDRYLQVRGLDAEGVRILGAELAEARERCLGGATDTALLLLRRAGPATLAVAALDEAVDHYGQQMIYLLVGPHADFQREFLDRVRMNTIKHFQVPFFYLFLD
jgi:hypothetical protein